MAVLVLVVLILGMAGGISGTQWCVCRSDLGDAVLQKSIDYACGAGADCSPIIQNGACYQPNTVKSHCNYAVNSYYQRKGQVQGSCDFSGTAIVTTTDPSSNGCSYPSSGSQVVTTPSPPSTPVSIMPPSTTTPSMTPPSTTTPSITPPSTTTPSITPPSTTMPFITPPSSTFNQTPPTSIIGGGISSGLGPTGITTDQNLGFLATASMASLNLALFFSSMILLRV